jgi:hypothetical protein
MRKMALLGARVILFPFSPLFRMIPPADSEARPLCTHSPPLIDFLSTPFSGSPYRGAFTPSFTRTTHKCTGKYCPSILSSLKGNSNYTYLK